MRWPAALLLAAGAALVSRQAAAYRPFDGTDADVAELGEFELELGPTHWYNQAGQNYAIAPATVLNFGIFENTELVIDFEDFVALGPLDGRAAVALRNTDVLVKHIFREGILQGKTGLSIAVEAGPLTPEINGTNAFGASANALFSYRWDWGTVHFNEWPSYTREHNLDLFSGVIVEGPHEWVVRPVSEIFVEKEFNGVLTESAASSARSAERPRVVSARPRGAGSPTSRRRRRDRGSARSGRGRSRSWKTSGEGVRTESRPPFTRARAVQGARLLLSGGRGREDARTARTPREREGET